MGKWYPTLKIGKHIPKYPLIQGGMGVKISGGRLAGSVARCGAIGTIATVGLAGDSPHYNGKNYFEASKLALLDEFKLARDISPDGILAANCMVALTNFEDMVRYSVKGGANIIIAGAGLPLKMPEYTKENPDVALVPIVSSVKAAKLIVKRWEKYYKRLPDAFVVETPNHAGGHLGVTKMEEVNDPKYSLERVVPELVEYIQKELKADIPVIAAGGIWSKEDAKRAFSYGAKGIQLGTRFICTKECDASYGFKEVILNSTSKDVVIIKSPVGIPGRAVKTPFVAKYLEGEVESKPCIANCLTHCSYKIDKKGFCIAQALIDAFRGDYENGLFFTGDNIDKCTKIETAEDIIKDIFGD